MAKTSIISIAKLVVLNLFHIFATTVDSTAVEKNLKRVQELAFGQNSRMIVVTGRRRIGKTSLIKQALKGTPTVYFFIGRKAEIHRLMQVLGRRTKNNPCLIGEPGVGKTAIAEGLAQRIVLGAVPPMLQNKRVVTLDMASMVAGSKYRGEFEERIKKVIQEVTDSRDVLLFIDELHTIIGAGGAEGAMDASNILKPSLSRGEIQLIGATTIEEYRKYIEKDPALERRFQPVMVEEPSEEETLEILKGTPWCSDLRRSPGCSSETFQTLCQRPFPSG